MMNSISVKCRRCGKNAPASDFVLDPVYRLMVCPNCVKERKSNMQKSQGAQIKKTEEVKPEIKIVNNRPPGWDAEDDYLENIHAQRKFELKQTQKSMQQVGDKLSYKCYKCKHTFIYNISKRYPNLCPNCGSAIQLPPELR